MEILLEMVQSRKEWRSFIISKLLGALGEFAKLKYYREYGMPDYWSEEIKSLLKQIEFKLSKEQKTTSTFDMKKAFKEIFEDYKDSHDQIVNAKNQILHIYLKTPMQREKFLRFFKGRVFDSSTLLKEMLKEFSIVLYDIVKQ